VHSSWPDSGMRLPGMQASQSLFPAVPLVRPGAHASQAKTSPAPSSLRCVPAGQGFGSASPAGQ